MTASFNGRFTARCPNGHDGASWEQASNDAKLVRPADFTIRCAGCDGSLLDRISLLVPRGAVSAR